MFRRISLAALLTLSLASASFGGTIPGSRTSGTITGSRSGTITGSRTGTITGSRSGTISGSRTGLLSTQSDRDSRFRIQDDLLSILWLLLSTL
jgi:hypothetical protein